MKIQLHDNGKHLDFAPLTLTRAVGSLRIGIFTNEERWKLLLPDCHVFFETEDYLSDAFESSSNAMVVNATMIPNSELVAAITMLKEDEELTCKEGWIARCGTGDVRVEYKRRTANMHQPSLGDLPKEW